MDLAWNFIVIFCRFIFSISNNVLSVSYAKHSLVFPHMLYFKDHHLIEIKLKNKRRFRTLSNIKLNFEVIDYDVNKNPIACYDKYSYMIDILRPASLMHNENIVSKEFCVFDEAVTAGCTTGLLRFDVDFTDDILGRPLHNTKEYNLLTDSDLRPYEIGRSLQHDANALPHPNTTQYFEEFRKRIGVNIVNQQVNIANYLTFYIPSDNV